MVIEIGREVGNLLYDVGHYNGQMSLKKRLHLKCLGIDGLRSKVGLEIQM